MFTDLPSGLPELIGWAVLLLVPYLVLVGSGIYYALTLGADGLDQILEWWQSKRKPESSR